MKLQDDQERQHIKNLLDWFITSSETRKTWADY